MGLDARGGSFRRLWTRVRPLFGVVRGSEAGGEACGSRSTVSGSARWAFTTAASMIAALSRAVSENRLDERLKIYTVPRLLIVDEIRYLPIDRTSPTSIPHK